MANPTWRLTRGDLAQHLPVDQGYRFIDRVLRQDNQSVTIMKNISQNEWCMSRKPGQGAVFPTLILLEVMAQAAGFFEEYLQQTPVPSSYFLVRIPHAEFHLVLEPGDQVILTVTKVKRGEAISTFAVRAEREGQLAAKAEIVFLRNLAWPSPGTPEDAG